MQTDEQEVINFLLTTEIIPLCLRIMESGSELSKTVATFILQKILLDETGLSYICQTFERFSHVSTVLVSLILSLHSVWSTVELLCCGHLGDLVKCPVYSGTPLLWTPWGPGGMSCIQWNPSIVDTLGTWWSVLYTVEPLYCGHLGDLVKCPVYIYCGHLGDLVKCLWTIVELNINWVYMSLHATVC